MAYIGIDVSKQKLDCLWVRDLSKSKVKTKVFPNRHQYYPGLIYWLFRQTMHKLVHIAYGVLKSQSEYRPQGT